MAYVSRDPFARVELHRETVSTTAAVTGCAWCGFARKGGKLYRYRVESDGGRVSEDSHLFCSKSCRTDYYF